LGYFFVASYSIVSKRLIAFEKLNSNNTVQKIVAQKVFPAVNKQIKRNWF